MSPGRLEMDLLMKELGAMVVVATMMMAMIVVAVAVVAAVAAVAVAAAVTDRYPFCKGWRMK